MTILLDKKILFIITKSNFGGAQRYVFELAKAMKYAGYNVAVASAPAGLLVDTLKKNDITHFPIKSFQRDISVQKEISAISELQHCYKYFKPDIVHLNSSKAGILGAISARLSRVPSIVYTVHGWPFFESKSLPWRALVWIFSYVTTLLSHRIILVTQHDYMHSGMPFVKQKMQVITTAVPDIDFMDTRTARESLFASTIIDEHIWETWLSTTAELHQNKNLFAAIDAVAMYNSTHPDQKVFYTIFGEGELRSKLQEYITRLQVGSHVYLMDYVPDSRNYLKAFDMFLLPSKKEGLPYALIEAGAAKVASIASNVGGIPEVITDGVNGILIDPNETASIVAALVAYVQNTDIRKLHATALHKTIIGTFSLDDMVTETQSIYSSIILKS